MSQSLPPASRSTPLTGPSAPPPGGPAPFPAVALLGYGTMGAVIAHALAASGRRVVVLETGPERLAAGTAAVTGLLDARIARGEANEDDRAAVLARITGTLAVEDLAAADLVLESVTEDAELKKALLSRVAQVVGEHTPLLTGTSTLSVTDLASALPDPARFAGLHFVSPAPRTRTVEIVRALRTDEALVERLAAFVDTLDGRDGVVVGDRPGFLVNALLLPYLNDVIREYDDGLASAEDIDTALRLGLGYASGPFETLDAIGLDAHLRTTEAIHAATLDARYVPPPLLRRMVAAGRLGAATGQGFRAGELHPDN